MSGLRAMLLALCVAQGAGCARILGIDHEYGELIEDAGAADAGDTDADGPRMDAAEPMNVGDAADPDAADSTDAGEPAGFDCDMVGGTRWNDHCYFVIAPGTGLTWTRARTTCESFSDSQLVTLTSAEEQEAVESAFFPSTSDHWIGLSLEGASSQPPPSSCRTDAASCPFRWVTGEPLSYSNWARRSGSDREPNYTGACVRLQLADRSWADHACGTQLPAICEHD